MREDRRTLEPRGVYSLDGEPPLTNAGRSSIYGSNVVRKEDIEMMRKL
jgi:hypothetical protein